MDYRQPLLLYTCFDSHAGLGQGELTGPHSSGQDKDTQGLPGADR